MIRRTGCLVLALLSACGLPNRAATTAADPAPRYPTSATGRRYQTNATVLQGRGSGPELCLGVVLTSLPPQCGGPPITNWDWSAVDDKQTVSGVTWGEYHVTGAFDGKQFTLTEPPGPYRTASPPPDPFASPCPEPSEGWTAPDPSKAGGDAQTKAIEDARGRPDFAGVWLDDVVLNLMFTGDLERHEQQVREIWGGPLCLSKAQRTSRELREIQQEVTADAGNYDLTMLSVGVDEIANAVSLEVVVVHAGTQQRLDDRYGAGAVRVSGRLEPVR